jgi:hypothetical protein
LFRPPVIPWRLRNAGEDWNGDEDSGQRGAEAAGEEGRGRVVLCAERDGKGGEGIHPTLETSRERGERHA